MSIKKYKICLSTRYWLRWSLSWPFDLDDEEPGKWHLVLQGFFLLNWSIIYPSVCTYLYYLIEYHPEISPAECISANIAVVGSAYIFLLVLKNQPKISKLLKDLADCSQFGVPPNFEKHISILNFWSHNFCISSQLIVPLYYLFRLSQRKQCKKIKWKMHLERSCGLIGDVFVPFNVDNTFLFAAISLWTLWSCLLILTVNVRISFNILEVAHYVALKIEHLEEMILEYVNKKSAKYTLDTCILYHNEILNLALRVDECYSPIMICHLVLTAAVCGCIQYQIAEGINTFVAVLHMNAWFFALFIACVAGQHLLSAGESLSNTIWSCEWYKRKNNVIKNLRFMLARSQKKLYLTTGSFNILSYELFVSVLKMSYSIYTMIRKN